MKKLMALGLVLFLFTAAVNCFAEAMTVSNGGLTLSIPEAYAEKLIVELPENDERGTLFAVYEKKSVDIARAAETNYEGAGWLFSIGTLNEEGFRELRANDIPGVKFFAKDAGGLHYVQYQPTDVRMIREDYNDPAAFEEWGELNVWADSVPETFIAENEGLTADAHSSTMLDASIARILYLDNVNYMVSTLEHGPLSPKDIKAEDFLSPLANGVVYEVVRDEEAPDGEYVVLNFPDEGLRYDFFFMEGKENYIRQVWSIDEFEMLYKAVFEDGTVKATDVMHAFYQAIAAENGY